MLKRIILCFLALSFIFSALFASNGFAAYFEKSQWRDTGNYNQRAENKAFFGLANLTIGLFEIWQEPRKSIERGQACWIGIGKGLLNGILDPVLGAFNLITAPLPFAFTDIPLPEGGTDIVFKDKTLWKNPQSKLPPMYQEEHDLVKDLYQ